MKEILQNVWKTDKKSFLLILLLNIGVSLTSSVSIIMLVPMLDLLDVDLGNSGGLQKLLQPLGALPYLHRAALIVAVFVVLLLLRALFTKMATVRQNAFLERYSRQLRQHLYDSVRSADWEILTQRSYADLINLFTTQCWQAKYCLQEIIVLFASFVSAAMQLAIACWLSLPVTLVVLVVGGGFLLLFRPFLARSKEYGKKAVQVSQDLLREIQNQLNSIKEIRAYGVESSHAQIFDEISQEYYDTSLRTVQLRVLPQFCYSIAAAVLVALAFVFSVLLMDTGTAQLMVLVYVFSRLWPIFSSWQGRFQSILSYLPAYEIIQKAAAELSFGIREPEPAEGVLPFEKEVSFENICFTYQTSDEEVLHNASFTLPYGSVTALVGPSGAGKSTTADLLLGLLRPTGGHIKVDGQVLRPEDRGMWRKAIGYIPQEPLILNATIRENLRRFHPDATESEMIEALKRSLAFPFVEKLPQGLDTMLGDKGVRLSGGERQRIVLARVLMGNPRLIILDEATSALDYESETFVRETIRTLRGNATVLIIAHRLATIRGADRAVVLEDGKIAEEGSLADLLQLPDSYLNRMVSTE